MFVNLGMQWVTHSTSNRFSILRCFDGAYMSNLQRHGNRCHTCLLGMYTCLQLTKPQTLNLMLISS